MAPGTNIGAASPVDSSGEDITGTLGEKVMNDAIANITAIAQARGRNVDWAVATVARREVLAGERGGRGGRGRRHRGDRSTTSSPFANGRRSRSAAQT